MKKILTYLVAFLIPVASLAQVQKTEEPDFLERQIKSEMTLLQVERLLGEFFESPKTLGNYKKYLPNDEQLGWCCTTHPSDLPYSIKTYDFHSTEYFAEDLQFEFIMDKTYKGEHEDQKIYAARLFCTLEGSGMKFYLQRSGSVLYKHLKVNNNNFQPDGGHNSGSSAASIVTP